MKPEFKIEASSFTGKERLVSSLLEEGYIVNVEEGADDEFVINVFGKPEKKEEPKEGTVVYSRPADYLKRKKLPVWEKKTNPDKDAEMRKILEEAEKKRMEAIKKFTQDSPYTYDHNPYYVQPIQPVMPYTPNVPKPNHVVWCDNSQNKPL